MARHSFRVWNVHNHACVEQKTNHIYRHDEYNKIFVDDTTGKEQYYAANAAIHVLTD